MTTVILEKTTPKGRLRVEQCERLADIGDGAGHRSPRPLNDGADMVGEQPFVFDYQHMFAGQHARHLLRF